MIHNISTIHGNITLPHICSQVLWEFAADGPSHFTCHTQYPKVQAL